MGQPRCQARRHGKCNCIVTHDRGIDEHEPNRDGGHGLHEGTLWPGVDFAQRLPPPKVLESLGEFQHDFFDLFSAGFGEAHFATDDREPALL